MKILIVPAFALALLAGSAAAEPRNLQGFTGVGAAGNFNVDIAVGDHFMVDVSGPDADKIETRIEHNSLQIKGTGWHVFGEPRYNARVHVIMPRVQALAAARGNEMRVMGVNSEQLDVSAAMGATIDISGSCRQIDVSAAMGAQVDANELDCATASVSAAMGGEVRVHAREDLSASASMGGDIQVSGNPQRRSANTAMGGNVDYD